MSALERVLLSLITLLLFADVAPGGITFNDGGVHTFGDVLEPDNNVRVDDALNGDPTTVNVVDGASFDDLQVFAASVANVSGGTFNLLWAYHTSKVTVSGGNFIDIWAVQNSTVDVLGGSFRNLRVSSDSTVDVSGGTFNNLLLHHDSTATVSGGAFRRIETSQNSLVDVSGGVFSGIHAGGDSTVDVFGGTAVRLKSDNGSQLNVFAGSFAYLIVYDNSSAKVSGGSFSDKLQAFGQGRVEVTGGTFGEIGANADSVFDVWGTDLAWSGINGEHLTGTLLDGTVLDIPVRRHDNAQINLHNAELHSIPEPASTATFGGLLGMGLIGHWWRRRKVA